jgi:hypothetical protein
VKNEATVTPARTSVAASLSRLAERPIEYVMTTAAEPPRKAATGSVSWPRRPAGSRAEARPCRDPEQVGVDERVPKYALVSGSCERQHAADERR